MDRAQQGAGCAQGGSTAVQGSALYLSAIVRALVREGQSLAFPCAEQGGLWRLSL